VSLSIPDAAELAARFGLGSASGPMIPIARGVMGRVWRLETDAGRWAVKALFDWASDAGAETDVALQQAAANAGVLLPPPVRSPAGRVVERIGERRWRVHQWMDLPPPPVVPVDGALAASAGALLAALHGLALAPPGGTSPWFTRQPPQGRWRELHARAVAAGAPWATALEAAMPAVAELGAVAAQAPPEPVLLCHCDLHPDNVRPAREGLAVLDWDHAGALPPSWELGYVLVAWCVAPDGGVDADGARTLAAAYRERTGTAPDRGLAMFAAAASAWLNFAAGQVAGALGGADDEQRAFALGNVTAMLAHPLTRETLTLLREAL